MGRRDELLSFYRQRYGWHKGFYNDLMNRLKDMFNMNGAGEGMNGGSAGGNNDDNAGNSNQNNTMGTNGNTGSGNNSGQSVQ